MKRRGGRILLPGLVAGTIGFATVAGLIGVADLLKGRSFGAVEGDSAL